MITLVACNTERSVHQQLNCFIKYDSLFSVVDTAELEIVRNTDSAAIEVSDKSYYEGQRGLMRFDENENLRYYAFLQNDHNDASFILSYDSLANRSRWTSSEVVQWNFYNTKGNDIKFTFFLCAFDRNYGEIIIKSGRFLKEDIELFESKFTKLICATVNMNQQVIDSTGKIYISGRWQDKCSKVEKDFIDSTTIPFEQLTNSVQQRFGVSGARR